MTAILLIVSVLSLSLALQISGLPSTAGHWAAAALERQLDKARTKAMYRRRKFQRIAVDLPARLSVPGDEPMRVRMLDLSVGGARLGGVGFLPVGTTAYLWVEGVELEVSVRVSGSAHWIGVSFAQDEITASRAASLMDRIGLGDRSFDNTAGRYWA